jgi:4-hydroxy-tetrahydrodipicolinate synthase
MKTTKRQIIKMLVAGAMSWGCACGQVEAQTHSSRLMQHEQQIDDIIKNKPNNFDVISGDDGITFPLITLGAVGVISVIGNALPKEFSRMVRLALNGDYNNALTIHHKFTELFKLLFVDGNPAGVKAMLNAMGLIENELRLPLVPSRISTMEKISNIVKELNIKC